MVKHSENRDSGGTDNIEDDVRKSGYDGAANITIDNWAGFGKVTDQFELVLYCIQKVVAKARLA